MEYLLIENVTPIFPDKVPCERHSHDVPSHGHDGADGVLLPNLCGVYGVLQIPAPGKTCKTTEPQPGL